MISYALLPLVIILGLVSFMLALVIGYGLYLDALGYIRNQRRMRNERNELALMSDRELKDIGINRNDIDAVVRGTYRWG